MDATFFLLLPLTLCIAGVIRSVLLLRRKTGDNLPPGPSFLFSNFLQLTKSLTEIGPMVKNLKSKYGSLISLSTGSRHFIYVGDHSLVHQLLIQKGAIFADRPRVFPVRTISTSAYGPTWRFLRRNLVSEILNPTRIKSYSWARKWVLHKLIAGLQERKPGAEEAAGIIKVFDHFQHAMFSLLALMCFGEKVDDGRIKEIAAVQFWWMFLVSSGRLNGLAIFPWLGKILFRNRLKQLSEILNEQERLMIPLIKSRANSQPQLVVADADHQNVTYVDTLMNLQLPEDGNGRKLTDMEMVSMCGEFFNGGTDTTATALLWIMANLVKYPDMQSKLYDEIVSVVGPPPPPPPPGVELESIVNESDVQKMPYLKAVVLEGLRRHPPGHLLLPHRATKEVEVEGYKIPEGATVNFMVSELGWDPKVWDDPLEFKPERFLKNDDAINGSFDITGSKGIKMLPFGAGRRMCPGYELAMLHLEYFVANLIWLFRWTTADGYEVDLSEKIEVTILMKNPLRTRILPRA